MVLIKEHKDKVGASQKSQLTLTKRQCYLKDPWEITLFIQYKIITHGLSSQCQLRILQPSAASPFSQYPKGEANITGSAFPDENSEAK